MFTTTKQPEGGQDFRMNRITQDMKYRLSLLNYAEKYGVTKAAIRYKTNRQYIYRWKKRYDGTLESLACKSRRPNGHPNQHKEEEIKLIQDMRRRNPKEGLVVFWVKLRLRGYTRSIPSLFRIMRKLGFFEGDKKKTKYVPKPYETMSYPGQRIQIDVKFVPVECLVGEAKGQKYYQYTAIDEYSRFRYIEAFKEKSTYSSYQFLWHVIKAFPFKIECVQTDNGFEFTNRLNSDTNKKTIFEEELRYLNIRYKQIKPYTPRHNGKVERSHRKDNERFYANRRFYSFEDLQKQMGQYLKGYNRFPMKPLGWKSPQQYLSDFLAHGVTYV